MAAGKPGGQAGAQRGRTPSTQSVMQQARTNLRNTRPAQPLRSKAGPKRPARARGTTTPKMPSQLRKIRKQVAKTNLPQTIL